MSRNKNKKDSNANVEFSVEYGDVNGVKLYEFPLKNQSKRPKQK